VPTWSSTESFRKDLRGLSPEERKKFRKAVGNFVADLKKGTFRQGLRVKGVQGAEGIFEMTWARDGRATFEYGPEVLPKNPHIVWRRCGAHSVLKKP
jgi:hypothetical protein